MMKAEELAQAWAAGYAIAFACVTLGDEIRGGHSSPDEIDARARALADRAMISVRERLDGKGSRGHN